MTTNTISRSLLLGAVITAPYFSYSSEKTEKEASHPNIIILFADDMGYGDIAAYGSKVNETPNLDKLANRGTLFSSFYVAAASCTPSRAALLTGCYPQRVGLESVVDDNSNKGLSSHEITIADLLKQHGYHTGMFGKWHLGHHLEFMPNQHGFTEFFGIPYSMDMWPFHPKPNHDYPPLPVYENEKVIEYNPDVNQMTTNFTNRAVEFIKKHKEEPFFLYLPYSQPHVPLGVSNKFRGKSRNGIYGDVVMELDWSVGQITTTLEKLGIDKNTIVMFSSDNGPWLTYGNHAGSAGDLREGKGTVYGGGHKVPFIVSMPGTIPSGIVNDQMITAMDILPTIMHMTKAEFPRMNPIDGKNIWPILSGQKGAKTPYNYFFFVNKKDVQAVRKGKWKLHKAHNYRIPGTVGKDGMPGTQDNVGGYTGVALYNIDKDPMESTNVASKHPQLVKELTQQIVLFQKDIDNNHRPVGIVNK
ncbi:sulfatase [Halosquirtibacter xylanolyticus]|uniref:sulfatase family protein n=1 Tax=Halosquirtibacter xylanolyticus TaxID=3374599 RepID=UPI00374A820E|nr:sulfatase [Prolixibacteraceae bacterium]